MEALSRYCRHYLRHGPHPFGGRHTWDLSTNDLERALSVTILILTTPTVEHRLKDLTTRFQDAFHAYLATPRDQLGALVNAVERMAELVEPFLKKAVLILYPTAEYPRPGSGTPLWHKQTEHIVLQLGICAADLRKSREDYWRRRSAADALWRVAYVSRHKGAHEAHEYGPLDVERIAYCVVGAMLSAGARFASDAGAAADQLTIAREAQDIADLLRTRSTTFQVTHELPTTPEYVRLYRRRDGIALPPEQVRLLFLGHCAGRGPVHYYLRQFSRDAVTEWAYDVIADPNNDLARGAASILKALRRPVPVSRVSELFREYKHRFRLAEYIQREPSAADAVALWSLHRHRRSWRIRYASQAAFARVVPLSDGTWLRRLTDSANPHTRDLLSRVVATTAESSELARYRREVVGRNANAAQVAALALGCVGSRADIAILGAVTNGHAARRVQECATTGLVCLLVRLGRLRHARRVVLGSSADRRGSALRGLAMPSSPQAAAIAVRAYRNAPLAAAEALFFGATEQTTRTMLHLVERAPSGLAAQLLVWGICTYPPHDALERLLYAIGRSRKVSQWDGYEVVASAAPLAARIRRGRGFIRRCLNTDEFWEYYGTERPRRRMPVANVENLVLMRNLAGLAFGHFAGARDVLTLRRMLKHSYWAVNRGGALGLARVAGQGELDRLLTELDAKRQVSQGEREALDALDVTAYCPWSEVQNDTRRFGALHPER